MIKDTAILVLNRNLPDHTDQLCDQLLSESAEFADLYAIESGSSQEGISKYCSFWARWDDAIKDGLRYPRGFNYGLSELVKLGKFHDYKYYMLVCNDVDITSPMVPILRELMEENPKVGILSPMAHDWPEQDLMQGRDIAYCWHVNHIIWMVRRELIEAIMTNGEANYMNFLYDGENFRGYLSDMELVAKGYVNEFATALTNRCHFHEKKQLLREKSTQIASDPLEINERRVYAEGMRWLRQKYGFNHKEQMETYCKLFFDRFFDLHPYLRNQML
ncbi:MAG: hypothetical protein AB3N28_06820 [Kordiimonas sp.]